MCTASGDFGMPCSFLFLEIYLPAEFRSNPDPTHLSVFIRAPEDLH